MKKFLTALIILISLFGGGNSAEAKEPFDVIKQEISYYHSGEKEISWLAMAILYASEECKVDPLLITAVMETESAFRFNAVSPVGAIGLMQLMPGTAQMIGVDPHRPLANIVGGAIYLKNQLNRFSGNGAYALSYAVAAYNAGPQAVINAGGIPHITETQNYVVRVVNNYNRLQQMLQG